MDATHVNPMVAIGIPDGVTGGNAVVAFPLVPPTGTLSHAVMPVHVNIGIAGKCGILMEQCGWIAGLIVMLQHGNYAADCSKILLDAANVW